MEGPMILRFADGRADDWSRTMADDPTSSIDLLRGAQAGDQEALNTLLARYWPRLSKWASGKLPHALRTMRDTGDLVQDAIIRALRKLDLLEIRTEGALIAYLRTSLQHAIIDELRRRGRRPAAVGIPEDAEAEAASPIDAAIGAELMEKVRACTGHTSRRGSAGDHPEGRARIRLPGDRDPDAEAEQGRRSDGCQPRAHRYLPKP